MEKYFINLKPESEEYLFILLQQEDGRIVDEIDRGLYWKGDASELTEISKEQYDKIMDCHAEENDEFNGDWSTFADYVLGLLNVKSASL